MRCRCRYLLADPIGPSVFPAWPRAVVLWQLVLAVVSPMKELAKGPIPALQVFLVALTRLRRLVDPLSAHHYAHSSSAIYVQYQVHNSSDVASC